MSILSLTEISKYISLILRHKPEVIGITLDEHGWANVEELIQGISKTATFDREMLEKIVATDNKKRSIMGLARSIWDPLTHRD